ncbi:MAG: iron-containing alcohol dehydrogenase [Clostridia bacterium]|nr:iron-containing alcohol dehydrogenase [Clostridia bacterium]
MHASFSMPTSILAGEHVIQQNAAYFAKLGSRALIVSTEAARLSGALKDLDEAFASQGIEYKLYEDCIPNPTTASTLELGAIAREYAPDFIVAVGGGSAMDAGKAASVMVANPTYGIPDLYSPPYANKPIPTITVPTTAGTGSEITFYSVLLLEDRNFKKSFGDIAMAPVMAMLDPLYTASMPIKVTIDTAVDALCHCIEGYLSKANNYMCGLFTREGFRLFADCYEALRTGELTLEHREKLMMAALYGGFSINLSRTLAVHSMGYALTVDKNLPHGRANGLVLAEYVRFIHESLPEKVDEIIGLCGCPNIDDFKDYIAALLQDKTTFTPEDIDRYVAASAKESIGRKNPVDMTEDDVRKILERSLLNN